MNKPQEGKPSAVPTPATQGGEVRVRWDWAEPTVWTERMLTALETGVKGGIWFSLIDKVWSLANLSSSFAKVAANKGTAGVDHVSVEEYATYLDTKLSDLSERLRSGSYRPQAVRRAHIPKPGSKEKRPLGIPTVGDRVVQGALRQVLEPIFERDFAEHSYGFRPGKGCKDALRHVDKLLKAGYRYVVDADLKSYFDTIPHDQLMERLQQKVADTRVVALVEAFLKAGIMDGLEEWEPEAGAPQGAVLSPLLSNIYLDPLDHLMAKQGRAMIRYADDFVVLCRSAEEAQQALGVIAEWTASAGLTLHPTKTRIADAESEGFDFLGYHFEACQHVPRQKSLGKLKDTVRDKTRRNAGRSLYSIIADLNSSLRGWFAYFKHSPRATFPPLDSWIRMRLRSILRRRHGGRGRGRGLDHLRWPNRYFAEHGLYILNTAHVAACQSSQR